MRITLHIAYCGDPTFYTVQRHKLCFSVVILSEAKDFVIQRSFVRKLP